MKAFSKFSFKSGKVAELDRQFPSYLSAWEHGEPTELCDEDTHFLYFHRGGSLLFGELEYRMMAGMYASVPGRCMVAGAGIAMSREGYKGFFQIGGPAEQEGRLNYIDGCTDSLLIPPVMKGDPCLNLLYFPPGIDQTSHTHPSDRIGMIMSGHGLCHFDNDGITETVELDEGTIFCIHATGEHKFSTPYGEHMRVLAYHPDSDFGPTNTVHPMINRTMVNGISASPLPDIQTKTSA